MAYFIRFGNFPKSGRSKIWNAPNVYMHGRVGSELPGMSVYQVKRRRSKWEIITDNLNSGSGYASLSELLYRHVKDRNLPIYLISAKALTWADIPKDERPRYDDYWMGPGTSQWPLQGTDGEPLVREFKGIKKLDVTDLFCESQNFPKDYLDEINMIKESLAESELSIGMARLVEAMLNMDEPKDKNLVINASK